MEEKRVCQGYAVIDCLRVGEVEIVLAHNPKAVSHGKPTHIPAFKTSISETILAINRPPEQI